MRLIVMMFLTVFGAVSAHAAIPEIGQQAPDFTLPDQEGKPHHLADYKGKTVILAFYPKDFTSGCTCEVDALQTSLSALEAKGAVLLGISADTVDSHKRFALKEKLHFPILADPDKKVIEAYGVLNKNGGIAYRVTFIVGPEGTIQHVDKTVELQFSRDTGLLTSRHGEGLALLLSDWQAQIGKPVPNFSLLNYNGKTVELLQPSKIATVVVFLTAGDPTSHAYAERLNKLAKTYGNIAFLGIDSNADDSIDSLRSAVEKEKYVFPIGRDENGALAEHFKVQVTPTVWVIDAKGSALYTGAIDDNQNATSAKKRYLQNALDEIQEAMPVTAAETRASGTPLKRPHKGKH